MISGPSNWGLLIPMGKGKKLRKPPKQYLRDHGIESSIPYERFKHRFWIFVWDCGYQKGGLNDFIGSHCSLRQAIRSVKNIDCYQIYDSERDLVLKHS